MRATKIRLGLAALAVLAAYAQERGPRLAVFQRMPLASAADGIDGELQVMQDARITPAHRKALWGIADMAMKDANPMWDVFKKIPPRNGVLRIVNKDGTVVDSKNLERPLAWMDRAHLHGGNRVTYLVTVDYGLGWGSYNGPITFLVEIAGGRMNWLDAAVGRNGKSRPIVLMQSLKTVWKIVKAPGGQGREILAAACRPGDFTGSDTEFLMTYSRYFFDGKKWVRLDRLEEGYSDFEDGFPARSLFP